MEKRLPIVFGELSDLSAYVLSSQQMRHGEAERGNTLQRIIQIERESFYHVEHVDLMNPSFFYLGIANPGYQYRGVNLEPQLQSP